MAEQRSYLPDVLTWLAHHFGVRVTWADWERRDVRIETRDIFADELRAALDPYREPIERHLRFQQQKSLAVHVGGPLNGRRYEGWKQQGARLAYRVGRAKWAVYELGTDGRAWFRGFAASKQKARRLELLPAVKQEGGPA